MTITKPAQHHPVPAYQHHIERILEVIYEKGVVSMDDLASLKKEGRNTIRVVNKNTSSQLPTEELYTTKQAYEALINQIPYIIIRCYCNAVT